MSTATKLALNSTPTPPTDPTQGLSGSFATPGELTYCLQQIDLVHANIQLTRLASSGLKASTEGTAGDLSQGFASFYLGSALYVLGEDAGRLQHADGMHYLAPNTYPESFNITGPTLTPAYALSYDGVLVVAASGAGFEVMYEPYDWTVIPSGSGTSAPAIFVKPEWRAGPSLVRCATEAPTWQGAIYHRDLYDDSGAWTKIVTAATFDNGGDLPTTRPHIDGTGCIWWCGDLPTEGVHIRAYRAASDEGRLFVGSGTLAVSAGKAYFNSGSDQASLLFELELDGTISTTQVATGVGTQLIGWQDWIIGICTEGTVKYQVFWNSVLDITYRHMVGSSSDTIKHWIQDGLLITQNVTRDTCLYSQRALLE